MVSFPTLDKIIKVMGREEGKKGGRERTGEGDNDNLKLMRAVVFALVASTEDHQEWKRE